MLEVRLLGQFDIRWAGTPLDLPSRPAQSLLAYLVLHPRRAHRRELLAGLLWPEATEANARAYLRQALWRIRKALGPASAAGRAYLSVDEIAIGFDPDAGLWLDVAVLDQPAAEAAPVEALSQAAAVYRGELLPGFYDDWVVLERERLQVVFDATLRRLLDKLVAERRWGEVLEWGERWIAMGHAPEPAFRALMHAYTALGDLASAAAAYQRCVEALHSQLGVEPSAATQAAYARLTRGAPLGADELPATAPAPSLAEDAPPAPGAPPYKGLQHFDVADAGLFHGRELLTAQLVGYLREHHFLAIVVGASGSGKSSVVRAGLIPALRGGQPLADGTQPPESSAAWPVHLFTPGARPFAALAASLAQPAENTAELEAALRAEPGALARRLSGQPALIVVDQFEELFTLGADEGERRQFIESLLLAVEAADGAAARLVITLRADYYAHCANYPNLRAALARHQAYIGAMSAEELRRAIEAPARQGDASGAPWEFEPGLVDLILRDAGEEPGALPLLSHALLETWKRRRGRRLTLKGYAEAGGVRGAIARTADFVFNRRLTPEQQAVARAILLRLTELGESGPEGLPAPDSRRRAALSELLPPTEIGEAAARTAEVLNILSEARLVTVTETTAEVAHEALMREWPRLRQWLAEDRAGLRLRRRLTAAAQEWEALERDPGALYRGAPLAEAAEWASQHPDELNPLEREFLEAGAEWAAREAAEREAQRQREVEAAQRLAAAEHHRAEESARAARRLRRRAVFLAAALLAAAALAVTAGLLSRQASRQASLAASRELAAAAIISLEVDPERSVLLALHALDVAYTYQAEGALHQALAAHRLRLTLAGQPGEPELTAIAYSPDGRRLATGQADGRLRIWDAATGEELLSLPAHEEFMLSVSYSADGRRLATSAWDGTARVWDAATGTLILDASDQTEGWARAALDPAGARLALASDSGLLAVVEVATGAMLLRQPDYGLPVNQAIFSPDGRWLAAALGNGGVQLWDVEAGAIVRDLPAHDDGVSSLAFSPDGERLATGSYDATARVWDLDTGQLLVTLRGHNGEVLDVEFSPNGQRLATTSFDALVKVWDVESGREELTLYGHVSTVFAAAFHPTEARLATAGINGGRIWDIGPAREWLALDAGAPLGDAAYSPDGARLAGAGWDGAVRVWDAASGQLQLTLEEHQGAVGAVAFSPDGHRLATASEDGTARVFAVDSGALLLGLEGHAGPVTDLAFSPDGALLATSSVDGAVILWDLASGAERARLDAGDGPLDSVVFSPDGERLAAAGQQRRGDIRLVRLWDIASGEVAAELEGHFGLIFGLAYSPDGRRLASSDFEGLVVNWETASGRQLWSRTGRAGALFDVAFSPDRKSVV